MAGSPTARIAVITYTTYGHVDTLAQAVIEGARSTGAEVEHFQIQELLSEATRTKMGAAPVRELPVIKAAQLKEFDGFLFGFPTRYGRAPAQVSAFFDQTGGEWAAGSLVGKFAGLFTGSAGQHGGQETTIFTTLPFLMHHGITYVPLGYRAPEISNEEKIVGGSPWGSSYVAGGQGSLPVLEDDKAAGRTQGKSFAVVVMTFARGQATPVVPVAAPATAVTSEPPVADVTGPVAAQEEPSTTTATDNKHTAAVAGSAAVVAGGAAVAGANAHGSSNPLNSLGAPLGESGPVTNLTSVAPGGEDKALGYKVPVPEEEARLKSTSELSSAPVANATPASAVIPVADATPAVAAAPAAAEVNDTPATEKTVAAAPNVATKEEKAATTAVPAAAKAPTPAKAAAPKKKQGFFASCCGSSQGDNLKN